MVKAILLFIILGAGLFVGTEYSGQQGYVLISIANKTLEMSVTTLVIMFIALLAVVFVLEYLVKKTLSASFNTLNWFSVRKMRRSRRFTNEGIIKLLEGDFKQAEKKVIRWAKHHDKPLLCYLIAAEAAESAGDSDKRDHYLNLASEQDDATLAVELTRARIWVKENEWKKALATLQSLQPSYPNNPILLSLLKQIYLALEEWQPLIELLPKLLKYCQLSALEEQQLTIKAYQGMLAHTAGRQRSDDLLEYWDSMPRKAKKEPALVASLAQQLMAIHQDAAAYNFISKQLKATPSSELYALLPELPSDYHTSLQTMLLKIIDKSPNNAEAHSSLGRLYLQQQHWSKAQHHFEQALSLRSSVSDYALLAQALDKQNMTQAAHDVTQKALSLLP